MKSTNYIAEMATEFRVSQEDKSHAYLLNKDKYCVSVTDMSYQFNIMSSYVSVKIAHNCETVPYLYHCGEIVYIKGG
jgi:hypothetical protein